MKSRCVVVERGFSADAVPIAWFKVLGAPDPRFGRNAGVRRAPRDTRPSVAARVAQADGITDALRSDRRRLEPGLQRVPVQQRRRRPRPSLGGNYSIDERGLQECPGREDYSFVGAARDCDDLCFKGGHRNDSRMIGASR